MKIRKRLSYIYNYVQLAHRRHPNPLRRRAVLVAALIVWTLMLVPVVALLALMRILEVLNQVACEIADDVRDVPSLVADSWRGNEVWSAPRWQNQVAHLKSWAGL